MALFPSQLADSLNNPGAESSILALSPAVLLVCLTSAYRGYCQGHENMTPTTVGQVLEVLAKVVAGLALAWYLTRARAQPDDGLRRRHLRRHGRQPRRAGYMFYYKRRHYGSGRERLGHAGEPRQVLAHAAARRPYQSPSAPACSRS